MIFSRRSVMVSAVAAAAAAAVGYEGTRALSAPELVQGASADAATTLAVGVALGSGYQNGYFKSLTLAEQKNEIQRMKAAHIGWVRMDAGWDTVQATAGAEFDWSVPDATAKVMLEEGMKLVVLLLGSPLWARKPVGAAPLHSPWPAVDTALYADYCEAAVAHYQAMGVDTFELWNEPNLDSGVAPAPRLGTPSGWGYLSPFGFADLAVAAYSKIKTAYPHVTVLGGTLGTHYEHGHGGTARTAASWPAVAAGKTSAWVACAHAEAGDRHMLLADADGIWPGGTIITAAEPGKGYTVAPPVWDQAFAAIRAANAVNVDIGFGYAPDEFLTHAYARADKKPMWDALAIHPYTAPYLPTTHPVTAGGWNMVPTLRDIMVANGEADKQMWITEFGAPSGRGNASWPTTTAAATSLNVSSPNASSDDIHYLFVGSGVAAGSYVENAVAGKGWTIYPPTGITLARELAPGVEISSLTVAATKRPVKIAAGTLLKVVSSSDTAGVTRVVKATTRKQIITSTTGTTTIEITSVTPESIYHVGYDIQADLGQTFGTAIPAKSHVTVYVFSPGVDEAGAVSEAVQAKIIAQACAVRSGIPLGNGKRTAAWPYVAALFIFCWSDAGGTAGSYGLVRADGAPKPALAALTAGT